MTREEAINIMKVIVHMLEEKYDTDRVEDAVEMAIKALEQEPCEDCISRQAVLSLPRLITDLDISTKTLTESVDIKMIESLPSVTPKPKTDVFDKIKEEIKDNTYFINETTEKEGIDFETVEKIINKYMAESEEI